MKIEETRVYCGPSPYGRRPVIRLTVEMGALADRTTVDFADFPNRLLDILPSLDATHLLVAKAGERSCVADFQDNFADRVRAGLPLPDVLPQVALALQCLAGTPVSFGQTQPAGDGKHFVIYEYQEQRIGRQAGELAVKVVRSALSTQFAAGDGRAIDLKSELDALARLADQIALGPSTAAIVDVARQRGIPHIRLNNDNLVQLGYGRHQKRIEGTITSRTGHIAVDVAEDKDLTNSLLHNAGIPVPRNEVVCSAEEAVAAAERLGYPVVTKPVDVSHGRGVSRRLGTAGEVRKGFECASVYGEDVLVEQFVTGRDHRVLVINDEVVAVAEQIPGHVVGDGIHSIRELVDIINRDPRRGVGHERVLNRIEIDEQAERLLSQVGYTFDTVLPENQVFHLRSTGDVAAGGTAVDRTEEIHYDNARLARRAAKVVGLDVAGVDVITPDISRPLREVGGAIVEVNPGPDFRLHVAPSEGQAHDVATPVVDMLFPSGTPARIPIAAITGTNGKTTAARMVAHILKMSGDHVGLTTSDGIYVDGEQYLRGDMTGPWSARLVLKDPTVDAAVLETALDTILERGLGFDQCDVAAVLNVQNDHLGTAGGQLETLDDVARIKSVAVESVPRDGHVVLNADDSRCVEMAQHTDATPLYFAMNARNQVVKEHLADGGKAVILEEGVNGQMVTLYEGERQTPLLWTHLIPATVEGAATFNVANALAATAICYALRVSVENIRQGLRTFATTFFQTRGRLNLFDQYKFRVLVDSAHNPPAYRALADFVDTLSAERKVGVIGAPGDRRDEDVREMGRIAGATFEQLVIKEGASMSARERGEVAGLLRAGALEAGLAEGRITVILPELDAVQHALEHCHKDDLLVIVADDVTLVWKQVVYFGREGGRPTAGISELEIVEGGQTRRLIGPRPGPPRINPEEERAL